MPTEPEPRVEGVDVFLFAHQDDECFAFEALRRSLAEPRRVLCCYLTDGAGGGADPRARDAESRRVLEGLGIGREQVHFLGSTNGIPDLQLVDNLDRIYDWLGPILDGQPGSARLFTHAWEGGHPDHDAAHLLARHITAERGYGPVQCFASYHSRGLPDPWFWVLVPVSPVANRQTLP